MANALPSDETSAPAARKSSINLRIGQEVRGLIDDAAGLLGKTRTEFMVESARREAVEVLLDQRLFVLDDETHSAFAKALDSPPSPGPKLRKLMRKEPVWRK